MSNLWLFDIDGTLVNINHIHLASYKKDYKDVMKIDVPSNLIISTFGMSQAELHKEICRKLRIPLNKDIEKKLMKIHASNFGKTLAMADIKPLRMVLEFLRHLKSRKEFQPS